MWTGGIPQCPGVKSEWGPPISGTPGPYIYMKFLGTRVTISISFLGPRISRIIWVWGPRHEIGDPLITLHFVWKINIKVMVYSIYCASHVSTSAVTMVSCYTGFVLIQTWSVFKLLLECPIDWSLRHWCRTWSPMMSVVSGSISPDSYSGCLQALVPPCTFLFFYLIFTCKENA